MNDIIAMLESPKYEFLWEDPHLGMNICYLTIAGSKAYGTDLPDSDTDIRGFAIEQPEEIFGTKTFEQVEDKATDTVVYGLKKFVSLCKACNPNVIEMLGTDEDHVLLADGIGQYIRENAGMFLSKRAYATFTGYAAAQLRRLQNALCRDEDAEEMKARHIRDTLDSAIAKTQERYDSAGERIAFSTAKKENGESEILASVNLENIPVHDFLRMNADIGSILRSYGKLTGRNYKKDLPHLRKHAMHLIRLYLTGIDILEGKGIRTCRKDEHELLMGIRSGDVPFDEVFRLADSYEARIKTACEKSPLPDRPNDEAVDKMLIEIYRKNL